MFQKMAPGTLLANLERNSYSWRRMRWTPGGLSKNIEDRRGSSGGGFGMAPMGIGGTIILLVLGLIFGVDLTGNGDGGSPIPQSSGGEVGAPVSESPEEAQLSQFVSFVLDDAQGAWKQMMPGYRDAKLVLYRQGTPTGCGMGSAAAGPFYCPADEKVYLDLSFLGEMKSRLGASGDFAQAYVIAHELGHHVQHQAGIDAELRNTRGDENAKSVQLELQADCLAGVWGNSAARRDKLEAGDMEEGLNAASSIGDDVLQRQSTGMVRPESFTHGSAAQRTAALRRGLETGDPKQCQIGSF
jgi:predicted metalloprotease